MGFLFRAGPSIFGTASAPLQHWLVYRPIILMMLGRIWLAEVVYEVHGQALS